VTISSGQQDGWNTAAPTSSSAPMELTVELMGYNPFNPKVLAEREGFEPSVPVLASTYGLANLSFLGSFSHLNGLQEGWMLQNRVNEVSFGNFCSHFALQFFWVS
jgi:hypothetical protein